MPEVDQVTTGPPAIDTRYVIVAVVASLGGLLVHDIEEFPASILLDPETIVPVAITVLLGLAILMRPTSGAFLATGAWALIVMVVGGGSVLPLSIWPLDPAQTFGHYGAHAVYAVAQLPLLWVAWRGYRGERSRRRSTDEPTTPTSADGSAR